MQSPLDGAYLGALSCESLDNTPPQSPTKEKQPIDYTKYRTRMCRNYLMGYNCPFEDRCVFAHGEVQLRTALNVPHDAPPSYDNFVSEVNSPSSRSCAASRPNTPPAYPSRFRYEPYSTSGIVFQ